MTLLVVLAWFGTMALLVWAGYRAYRAKPGVHAGIGGAGGLLAFALLLGAHAYPVLAGLGVAAAVGLSVAMRPRGRRRRPRYRPGSTAETGRWP